MDSRSRNRHLVALTPLAFALVAMSAQAANRTDLHKIDVAQANHQYLLASSTLGAAAQPRQKHAEMLGLDANSALQVIATTRDADGTVHYRYQQTFRGVPIFGEHVVVSEDGNGTVRNLFGRAVNGLSGELPATSARLAGAQALSIAKAASLGGRAATMRTEREVARQMIYVDDAKHAHMSYVVSFFADSPRVRS